MTEEQEERPRRRRPRDEPAAERRPARSGSSASSGSAGSSGTEEGASRSGNARARNGPARRDGALLPAAAARRAAEQIVALTGRELESVLSVEKVGDGGGWRIGVEVVETRRIPDSADILASFQVDVDGHGELTGFRRTGRYSRGQLHPR